MKKYVWLVLLACLMAGPVMAGQDIALPEVKAKIGMDLIEAMEGRSTSRGFNGGKIPLEAISTILWAGSGIVHKGGEKTVHGYDALSGASDTNRYAIPWGWGEPYLKTYLLLADGAYEYLPEGHRLKFITGKDLIRASGSRASNTQGVIVLAADYDAISSSRRKDRNVAIFSAGSAAQNMYVAGAVYKIQMLTQVYIKNKAIKKGLNLPKHVEPLSILSFGYASR